MIDGERPTAAGKGHSMGVEQPREIKQVVAATGLTMESVGGVLTGRWLAGVLGAEYHVVHVIQPLSEMQERAIPGLSALHDKQAKEELEAFVESHGLRNAIRLHVARGFPVAEVLRALHEIGGDLLVVGRYGKGGLKIGQLGSVADQLVRKSPVSVLVVQPEFRGEFRRIGVATDLSAASALAVRRAVDLAVRLHLPSVTVLHAYEVPSGYHLVTSWEQACRRMETVAEEAAREMTDRILGEARSRQGGGAKLPTVKVRLAEGPAARRVPQMAEEERLDVLVIGTHGRTSAALALLGRTSEKIIRNATCSVWAEKSPMIFQNFLAAMRELIR